MPDPELNTPEDSTKLTQEAITDTPVGRGPSGGATCSHMDPLPSEVDKSAVDEDNPFWALLPLAGYETWSLLDIACGYPVSPTRVAR